MQRQSHVQKVTFGVQMAVCTRSGLQPCADRQAGESLGNGCLMRIVQAS